MLAPKHLNVLLKAVALHGVFQTVDVSADDILGICAAGGVTDSAAATRFATALEVLIASAAREDWTPAEMAARSAASGVELDELARETIAAWWRDNRSNVRSHLQARARRQPQLISADWKVATVTATSSAAQFEPEPSVLLRFSVAAPGQGVAVASTAFGVEADRTALAALLRGARACLGGGAA